MTSRLNVNYLVNTVYFVLACMLVFAVVARFFDVGFWPFAIDEFYIIQSVKSILDNGLPDFTCGGYYTRGLLFQYLLAASQFVWPAEMEFSFRLWTLFIHFLAVPPLYLLVKRIADPAAGFVVVVLFMLSVWEFEFSRFIRMYAPFQTLFLYYLYCFYQTVVENREGYYKYMLLLSVLAVFVYEGAVFLLAMNFFPWILTLRLLNRQTLYAAAVFVAGFLYMTTDFRSLGAEPNLSEHMKQLLPADEGGLPLALPKLLLLPLLQSAWYWIVVPLVAVVWSGYATARGQTVNMTEKLALITLLGLGFLHLFGFMVAMVLLFVLIGWLRPEHWKQRPYLWTVAAIGVCGLFWFAYGLSTQHWYMLVEGAEAQPLKKLLVLMLKYPDMYTKLVYQWVIVMPVITAVMFTCVAAALVLTYKKTDEGVRSFRLLAAVMIALSLILSVIEQTYYTSRYSFYMYPLVLVLTVLALFHLAGIWSHSIKSRRLTLGVAGLVLIAVSEDVSFAHLWDSVSARRNADDVTQEHLYIRLDYRSPARYIEEHKKPDEPVLTTVIATTAYLQRLDYFYQDISSVEVKGIAACGGQRELWTHARLLYTPEQALDLVTQSGRTFWVMIWSPEHYGFPSRFEQTVFEQYRDSLQYQSPDGWIHVYKIKTAVP